MSPAAQIIVAEISPRLSLGFIHDPAQLWYKHDKYLQFTENKILKYQQTLRKPEEGWGLCMHVHVCF